MRNTVYAHAPRLPEGELIDPLGLFATPGPIELEIGPGRGGFLFERLLADPEIRMVGLEIRRKWATIVDDRLRERGFGERARVFAEDARDALKRFPSGSLRRVFVHFPDPWWKKKHQKRLVVGSALLAELGRVIEDSGELFIQTDVPERAHAYHDVVAAEPRFAPAAESAWIEENPFSARSPREHRAIADGLPVFRLLYRRVG